MAEQKIDIIYGDKVTKGVDAEAKGEALWLSGADLARVSGWEFKPQGLCRGNACYPVPAARKDEFVAGFRYNLTALAGLLSQPVVADPEQRAWSFGESAGERRRALSSLNAPDFSLPDLGGKMHSLADHRGKKVLLVSWASW